MQCKVIMTILLVWVAISSTGCATSRLWESTTGYQPQKTNKESVTNIYMLQRPGAVSYLVPGYPSPREMFSLTAAAARGQQESCWEIFRRYSQYMAIQKIALDSDLYSGRGYRMAVDFTATLPADKMVELFTHSRYRSVAQYERQGQQREQNFQIHFRPGSPATGVDHYTSVIIRQDSPVKVALLSADDEFDLLASAQKVPLRDAPANFQYTAWEYEKSYDVALPLRVLGTPPAMVFDAVGVVAFLPAFGVYILAGGGPF